MSTTWPSVERYENHGPWSGATPKTKVIKAKDLLLYAQKRWCQCLKPKDDTYRPGAAQSIKQRILKVRHLLLLVVKNLISFPNWNQPLIVVNLGHARVVGVCCIEHQPSSKAHLERHLLDLLVNDLRRACRRDSRAAEHESRPCVFSGETNPPKRV